LNTHEQRKYTANCDSHVCYRMDTMWQMTQCTVHTPIWLVVC